MRLAPHLSPDHGIVNRIGQPSQLIMHARTKKANAGEQGNEFAGPASRARKYRAFVRPSNVGLLSFIELVHHVYRTS